MCFKCLETQICPSLTQLGGFLVGKAPQVLEGMELGPVGGAGTRGHLCQAPEPDTLLSKWLNTWY